LGEIQNVSTTEEQYDGEWNSLKCRKKKRNDSIRFDSGGENSI